MSRSPLLLAFLSFFHLASAQDPGFFLPDSADPVLDPTRRAVFLEGEYGYGTSSIPNEFIEALRSGSTLSRELRTDVQNDLADNNRFGQVITGELRVLGCDSLFRKPWLQGHFAISYTDIIGAHFTRDLYGLTFFGNAPYEDRTAELAPSALEQQRYQQIGWGVLDHRSLSWIRLSAVIGQSFQVVDIREGDLYTAPDGRVLDSRLDATFARSDTANPQLGAVNGIGLALSGRWNKRFGNRQQHWFSAELRDLGIMRWNERSLYLEKDTAYSFEGIYVENVFDVGDLIVDEDYLRDTLALNYSKQAQWRMLPFQATVRAYLRPWDRAALAITVQQRYGPGFVPAMSVTGYHHVSHAFRWGGGLSYGGYGSWRVGLEADAAPGKHIYCRVGFPDLFGFFNDQAQGQAAGGTLGWRF